MKYGIVGNRTGWDKEFVFSKIDEIIFNQNNEKHQDVMIISGGATGVDTYALNYAEHHGISYKEFIPDEKESSPERYFNRNKKIAEYCDILIAFNNKSGRSGTINTIKFAHQFKKDVIVITK